MLGRVILSGAKDLEILRRPVFSGTPQNDIQKHSFRRDSGYSYSYNAFLEITKVRNASRGLVEAEHISEQ